MEPLAVDVLLPAGSAQTVEVLVERTGSREPYDRVVAIGAIGELLRTGDLGPRSRQSAQDAFDAAMADPPPGDPAGQRRRAPVVHRVAGALAASGSAPALMTSSVDPTIVPEASVVDAGVVACTSRHHGRTATSRPERSAVDTRPGRPWDGSPSRTS